MELDPDQIFHPSQETWGDGVDHTNDLDVVADFVHIVKKLWKLRDEPTDFAQAWEYNMMCQELITLMHQYKDRLNYLKKKAFTQMQEQGLEVDPDFVHNWDVNRNQWSKKFFEKFGERLEQNQLGDECNYYGNTRFNAKAGFIFICGVLCVLDNGGNLSWFRKWDELNVCFTTIESAIEQKEKHNDPAIFLKSKLGCRIANNPYLVCLNVTNK